MYVCIYVHAFVCLFVKRGLTMEPWLATHCGDQAGLEFRDPTSSSPLLRLKACVTKHRLKYFLFSTV